MNPSQPPSDRELDQLLASRLKRTSPEFELRLRELRVRLAGNAAAPRFRIRPWWVWPGLATAALAFAAAVILQRQVSLPPVAPGPVSYEELFALDAALAPAAALLNGENRDAVLRLPVNASL
jgi:hypothetical protein